MRSEIVTTVEHRLALTVAEVAALLEDLENLMNYFDKGSHLWELCSELEYMKNQALDV